jgi:pilus assembly protein Flp/PilA
MSALLKKLGKDRKGATAIEYGLIAAFVAVAIISAASGLGTKLSGTFNYIATQLPQGGAASGGTTP